MNRAGLTKGSVAGSGASGGDRIMETEASVHNKLAEVWGFAESDRGRFDEEVLNGWIQGVNVEAFSKDLFESVEARIISSGEGKVMGVMGVALESSELLCLDEGDRIPMGGEGLGDVTSVGVHVFGMGADTPPPCGKGIGDRAFSQYGVATVVNELSGGE